MYLKVQATGLYYIAELVEERPKLTRKIISLLIKIIVGLHVALLLVDRLPLLPIALGVVSHALYHRLLHNFPYINVTSAEFLGSCGLLAASHVAWFRWFLYDRANLYTTLEWMFGFLLVMLWLVPFIFFISLSANEAVLPGLNAPYPGYVRSEADPSAMAPKRSKSTLLGVLNLLKKKSDAVLPQASFRRMEKVI
eukprot:jgi/Mesen1/4763/ME000242S03936